MAEELTPSRHRGGRHLVQQRLTQALLSRVVLVLLLACAMCPPAPAAVAAPPHRAHPLAVALPTRQWLPGTAPAQGPAFVDQMSFGSNVGVNIESRTQQSATAVQQQSAWHATHLGRFIRQPPQAAGVWVFKCRPAKQLACTVEEQGAAVCEGRDACPLPDTSACCTRSVTHQLNAPQGPAPAPAAHGEACKAAAAAAGVGALRRRLRGSRVLLGPADSPHTAQAFCKDARVGDCLVGESRGRARSVVLLQVCREQIRLMLHTQTCELSARHTKQRRTGQPCHISRAKECPVTA